MMLLIVDDTELSWCHTVDLLIGMNDIAPVDRRFYHGLMVFRCMSDLETNVAGRKSLMGILLAHRR